MEKREPGQFHAKTADEILRELGSDQNGLSLDKSNSRRIRFGFNVIPEKKARSPLLIFLSQFQSTMVYILIIAAAISFLLGKMVDVYVILIVTVINSTIGFAQEYRAEKAVQALKKIIVPQARILRDGKLMQIPAKNLVPGDIIILEEGDRIPADARLLELKDFRTVESSLTGESLPVDKFLKPLPLRTPLADQKNMVWLGTFVASGKAKALVVATGAGTALGKLAVSLDAIPRQRTHFQERTDVLAKHLAIISIVGALVIFLVGFYIRQMPFTEIFLFAIAALVSAIPEGLPAVLAIVLAIGAYRMANKKAVIRERYSTETLGIIDTIVSDKTGTITENTMTVQEIFLPGQKNVFVTGTGWSPSGVFIQDKKQIIPLENSHLNKLLHISLSCNNARIYKEQDEQKNETYKIVGDPTEAALVVVAQKAGLTESAQYEKRIDDIPFNSSLKYHASLSVLHERNSKREVYVVGAPEAVMKSVTHVLKNGRKTKMSKVDYQFIEAHIESMTNKAMRVLAAAYKEVSSDMDEIHEKDATDLVFVGAVGMQDPPREGVREAIEKAKKAGIRVIMATGDHRNTAVAVARQVGLVHSSQEGTIALTGDELTALNEHDFHQAIRTISVFARLTPEVKLRIAKSLQKHGHVVAMTGDGVNDAPALKQADIGISMGCIGTDVAREASDVILTDDNFASIINAIEEGRTVFINTRQTTFFLITSGLAGYFTILATLFLGLPLPLLPIQVLWLNLVTGGVTDVSLSTEQSHHDVLEEKPRDRKENILNKEIFPYLILITLTMLVLTLSVFYYHLPDEQRARTAAFTAMSFTQLFLMFNMRSMHFSVFKIGLFANKYVIVAFFVSVAAALIAIYNPFLQGVFNFVPLSWAEMFMIFILSSFTLWFGEAYKYIWASKSSYRKAQ